MENLRIYKLPRRPKPDLLPPPPYCRKFEQFGQKPPPNLMMEVSDPTSVLLLVESLYNTASAALEVKINTYLQTEIPAEVVLMITFLPKSEEAIVKAVGEKELESQYRISVSKTVLDIVIEKAEAEIDDDNIHPDIMGIINAVLNIAPENIFTVAIISNNKEQATPILVCVINSETETDRISKYVREIFRFCLSLILNTSYGEEQNRLKDQYLSLLQIAKKLFSSLGNLEDLLKHIMGEARKLTNAERCSLFLLDPDNMYLVAKVFDGGAISDVSKVVRISKDQGIAGHVVATGKLLNIKNAYKHPLFYKGVDESTGFRTRNILCFPIKDEKGIIGVAQLCNKKTGSFNTFDEQVSMAFSIYCGLSIMHSMVYKKIEDAQKRSQLSSELMLYHMKVGIKDVTSVTLCARQHDYSGFDELTFSPREICTKETPCFVLKMFIDLDMLNKFSIKRDKLAHFILHVQKGYRNNPYHNWSHAFTVVHFIYLILKNANLQADGFISDLEALSLLIATLCHDIDHRGTTNSFQLQSNNVLARLYSSEGSVMERHHLSQTLCILNSENCNFLENLDNACYTKVIDLLRDNILATDLAIHLKILPKMKKLVTNGYSPYEDEHKHLLLSMLMTCADLSDQTKLWRITRGVAVLIYDEFFKQGDMEKQMGKTPHIMMDREKANIPELQIHFLQDICLPVFEILNGLFPSTSILLHNVKKNIRFWETSKPIFEKHMEEGKTSYDILMSLSFENEVEDKVLEDEAAEEEEEEEEEQTEADTDVLTRD